ncbi:hypothetical protein BOTBODRAFT_563203 [Botryobasidium botryosum FD-172 SS1]|uniref:F-box domain-containing protein n=1 Tax=Botryobasidium botryosum (strain FD-172 SS1) TaxID=930990 RepID=A0A067LYZ6_BOTB1|nr:hypothetical protein BOTBODRAFT_563203 [Botryobasidium botryosum FD-172 SS1]
MEPILLSTIPRLIQGLCRPVRECMHVEYFKSEGEVTQTIQKFAQSAASSFLPRDIDDLHGECQTVARACEIAVGAVHAYTHQVLLALKSRHNRMILVSRLPDNVVALIFQFATGCRTNSLQPLEVRAPLNVSRVSRSWRKIALENSSLWSKIDAMNVSIKSVFIRRSGASLLNIEFIPWAAYKLSGDEAKEFKSQEVVVSQAFGVQAYSFSRFIKSLTPYINRWGSLRLQGREASDFSTLRDLLAPRLEALHIELPGVAEETEATQDTFFNGQPRDLHFAGVYLPLNSILYTGLTSLHLGRIRFTSKPSVHQLVRNLAACPCLKGLTLDRLSLPPPFDYIPATPVSLNSLQKLTIASTEDARAVQHIIRSVCAPSSLRLELSGLASSSLYDYDLLPQDARLGQFLQSLSCIRSLTIQESPESLLITGKGSPGNEILVLKLNISFIDEITDVRTTHVAEGLRALTHSLQSLTLDSLAFEGLDDWTSSTAIFGEMLSVFPTITFLSMDSCSSSFVNALTDNALFILCPRLHTLQLINMHISGDTVATVGSRAHTNWDHQSSAAVPLRRLILSRCYGEVRCRAAELARLVELSRTD